MRGDERDVSPVGVRLVLGAGVLVGLAVLAQMALARPHMLGANFRVYHVAARAAVAGENLYLVAPDEFAQFRYLYPPVTVLAFVPFALVSWQVGFALHTLGTLAVAVATAVLLVRFLERRGVVLSRFDRLLVAGWLLLGVHAVPSLFFGQINHHLLALLALGFVSLERGEEAPAGAAFALGALVKLFPALAGVWLLRRRAWRAIGAAVASGVGLLSVGVLAFGVGAHRAYVVEAILPRREHDKFAGGLDPGAAYVTLRRPVSHLFPALDPGLYGPLAVAVLAPVVAYLYLDVDEPTDRLVAIFGTVAAMVLVVPSLMLYVLYLTFPMIPLLYLLDGRTPRRLFVGGALLANFSFTGGGAVETITALPLPSAVSSTLTAVLSPALTFGTPPLYGIGLMLLGCVVYRRNGRRTNLNEGRRKVR